MMHPLPYNGFVTSLAGVGERGKGWYSFYCTVLTLSVIYLFWFPDCQLSKLWWGYWVLYSWLSNQLSNRSMSRDLMFPLSGMAIGWDLLWVWFVISVLLESGMKGCFTWYLVLELKLCCCVLLVAHANRTQLQSSSSKTTNTKRLHLESVVVKIRNWNLWWMWDTCFVFSESMFRHLIMIEQPLTTVVPLVLFCS